MSSVLTRISYKELIFAVITGGIAIKLLSSKITFAGWFSLGFFGLAFTQTVDGFIDDQSLNLKTRVALLVILGLSVALIVALYLTRLLNWVHPKA